MDRKILTTGDYCHAEFRGLIGGISNVTLVPLRRIETHDESDYDLIVVAQSHPDQFTADEIEALQAKYPLTPVVALLGSWCEGESRSGNPWPGVVRVYWHQWQGRLDLFEQQLESTGYSSWHEPRIATVGDRLLKCTAVGQAATKMFQPQPANDITPEPSSNFDSIPPREYRSPQRSPQRNQPSEFRSVANAVVDRILRSDPPHSVLHSARRVIGVSAYNAQTFDMLKDTFEHLGFNSEWIELSMETEGHRSYCLICIDANHLDEELQQRVRWIRETFENVPVIAIANFPRLTEVGNLVSWKVSHVVSKPFELNDLRFAIKAVLKESHVSSTTSYL